MGLSGWVGNAFGDRTLVAISLSVVGFGGNTSFSFRAFSWARIHTRSKRFTVGDPWILC